MELKTNYKSKEENSRIKQLSLDSISILHVIPTEDYMVSMTGTNRKGYKDRILLSSKMTEKELLEQCQINGIAVEKEPITNYMPEDYIGIYNNALHIGRYDYCYTILKGMESHINYVSKEKKELEMSLKK